MMKKKIIYRKPLGEQDRFIISTTHAKTKNMRRGLELCKEMYINRVNFCGLPMGKAESYAISCEEVALDGMLQDANTAPVQSISVADAEFSPEKLRMKVFAALVCGALGIEYDSIYDGGITRDSERGPLFRYIEDMNYRITQYGRTLMALQNVGVYCAADVLERNAEFAAVAKPISESRILAEQELPAGLVVGEFVDSEGNRYLLYQNADYEDKKTRAFALNLKKNFRIYRVNPHDGKQVISKDSMDTQKILIMPGDADLLRYQDAEDEACFIEYALKK